MPVYFIIDTVKIMSVFSGIDKQDAMLKYNDINKIKADACFEATPCVHAGKFLAPELPEWMEIKNTAHGKICQLCINPMITPDIIELPKDLFFKHDKSIF